MSPMTPADIAEGKRQLTVLCVAIGCSGLSRRCPGDPCCSILQKIGRSQWAAETIAASQQQPAGETKQEARLDHSL